MRDLRHEQARAFGDLADWLVHLELEGKRPKTLYGYARAVAPLLRAHPGKTVGEFTHQDVNEELRKVPPRSRHISRSIYNGWFTWALMFELVDRNPMFRVPKIRNPKRRPGDIFSEGEITRLEGLPMPDGPLWTLLFKTGMRRGEARRLARSHISLDRARLVVYGGKGDKDRVIPLPPAALAAVADLDLIEGVEPHQHLWYCRPGGGTFRSRRAPIGDTTFEHWYKRGIEAAGVRYLNPHQTRHTYGWWLRGKGFDIEDRQLLMGHESIRTTEQYYGRLTVEDVADKIALLA